MWVSHQFISLAYKWATKTWKIQVQIVSPGSTPARLNESVSRSCMKPASLSSSSKRHPTKSETRHFNQYNIFRTQFMITPNNKHTHLFLREGGWERKSSKPGNTIGGWSVNQFILLPALGLNAQQTALWALDWVDISWFYSSTCVGHGRRTDRNVTRVTSNTGCILLSRSSYATWLYQLHLSVRVGIA